MSTLPIDLEQVDALARLARLELGPDEREQLCQELAAVLGYMQKLNRLNTDQLEPTSQVVDLVDAFRKDQAQASLPVQAGLANAPRCEGNLVVVPRMVEE